MDANYNPSINLIIIIKISKMGQQSKISKRGQQSKNKTNKEHTEQINPIDPGIVAINGRSHFKCKLCPGERFQRLNRSKDQHKSGLCNVCLRKQVRRDKWSHQMIECFHCKRLKVLSAFLDPNPPTRCSDPTYHRQNHQNTYQQHFGTCSCLNN